MIDKQGAKRLLIAAMGEERFYALRAKRSFRQAEKQGLETLFIHQMGKVGSTAIVSSLHACGYPQQAKIIQTHFLSPQGRSFVENLEIEGQGGWNNLPARTKNFLVFSRVVGQMLQDGYLQDHRSNVITLVRDPVATNLSGFFHNYLWWPPDLEQQSRARTGDYLSQLNQRFMHSYPHDVPLTWFDLEMKPLFGIDVYAAEFPKESGYKIYHGEHANLLLLKLEKLKDCAREAFNEFLGINDFRLERANEASDKWYADLYQEFKREVSLPESYLDRLYESPYMEHFHTTAEIEALRKKWRCDEPLNKYHSPSK
jgi:hypothetical protein